MNAPTDINWLESNREALTAEFAWLRRLLEHAANDGEGDVEPSPAATATLNFLSAQLGLSEFERNVVLLCAGVAMEPYLAHLCASAQTDPRRDYPNFGLALAVLPGAHWSALAPQAPLRRWQLVQLGDPSHLTTARLALDERILHFLLGVGTLDTRLAALAYPLTSDTVLSASQQTQAARLQHAWREDASALPAIALSGDDPAAARAVAAQLCNACGVRPLVLRADELSASAEERNLIALLLTREYLLNRAAVIIEGAESTPSHLGSFLDQLAGPVILLGSPPSALRRACFSTVINKPHADEQRELWRTAMAGTGIDDLELARVAAHFQFSAADIAAAAAVARIDAPPADTAGARLWRACRRRTRSTLDHLAQRITLRAGWDDLVLPPGQLAVLHDLSRQVRHRATVYEQWGFAAKSARGLGISALFAGESGTGKTLAAEVIAADLGLDLYRIDLAAVVSKYIGETEKNLERLFGAAEASGAVLLFDEADALFGKRSEVKDSHDRYANLELAYLLQRMETYRGLSVLTTNLKSLLDTAFLRRIRFVVQFPFPDVAQRAEIWRRIFPEPLPRDELNIDQLARLHMAGGNIRNIAMNAAFLAADDGGRVGMTHLARAARMEYAKLEKPLSEAEIKGWS